MVEWEWYGDPCVFRIFMHLLLTANYEAAQWKGVAIEPGQKVTSLPHLAQETGLTVQQARTALDKLKSTGEITVKATNKYRLITVKKWSEYQAVNRQSNRQTTDNQQTNEQASNSNIRNKEIRTKETIAPEPAADVDKEVEPPKPPRERKAKEDPLVTQGIVAVLEAFQKSCNPTINFGNKTERDSARELVKAYGLETVLREITFSQTIKNEDYAPAIFKPSDLARKWPNLQRARVKSGTAEPVRNAEVEEYRRKYRETYGVDPI